MHRLLVPLFPAVPMPAPLFLITLRYLQPLEEVERHLEAHRAYLRQGYAQGVFLASGRLEPRTGGVILARAADRAAVDTLVAQDPFHRERIAAYTIQEWWPSMTAEGLEPLRVL